MSIFVLLYAVNLFDLKIGEAGVIGDVLTTEIPPKLIDIGFLQGTEINCKSVAPLGDPIIYSIGNTDIAIRKKLAQQIPIKIL